jgi:spore maturation protein CgeB
MRILLSGYHNPHYLTVTEYIERAIAALGHELIVFNDRNHVIPGRLRRRWVPLQSISVAVINLSLVRLAERMQPDLIVVTGGHRITRRALGPLIRKGFQVVLWTTDPPRADDVMRKTARHYHSVFCQGSEYVEHLRASGIAGARWLPMACDPQVHRPVDLSAEERRRFGSDVVFVGSYYPRRAELLRGLVRCGLSVWGPGWDALAAGDPLRACIRGPGLGPESWVRIYSAAEVILSIHYRSDDDRFPVFQASPRVFEAMACGAFVLTDRQKDVLELFKDGEHLASFSGGSDLERQVLYYLNHVEERRQIAKAGRLEVQRHHTYAHRVGKLLNTLHSGDRLADCRGAERPVAPSASGAHGETVS